MKSSINLQPPSFGPTHPLYPHLDQALRITGATIAGPSSYNNSSITPPKLYVGFVQQLNPQTMLPRDREPCIVMDMNGRGLAPGYHTGRLSGSYQSLPVYEVGSNTSTTGSGSGSCSPVIITETNILCENGFINVYTRPVQLNMTVSNCLMRITGDWILNHTAGCCPCAGSGSGSGGGSGSGSGAANCGGCCIPSSITAVVSGLTNGTCTGCTSVNGIYFLTYRDKATSPFDTYCAGTPGNCCWRTELFDGGCGSSVPPSLALHYDGNTGIWNLITGFGAAGVPATLQGTYSCNGPNTWIVDDINLGGYCRGPVTIVTTMCGGSGSGSGSGGGGITICGCSVPETWYLTLTNVMNCSCLAGSYDMTYYPGLGYWAHSSSVCSGKTLNLAASCSSGTWTVLYQCGSDAMPTIINSSSFTCSPLDITFNNTPLLSDCCFGTIGLHGTA